MAYTGILYKNGVTQGIQRQTEISQEKVFASCRIICGCLLLVALTGCVTEMSPEIHGTPSSRAITIRREYLPPFGGQTIMPPQRMADAATLWMPFTKEEHAKLTAHGGFSAHIPSAACSPVSAWLPPSEQEVMREYIYRLTVTQKAVTSRVLERAALLLPMIASVLEEQALPPELAALPLVESAFEPQAISPAGAVGLWQLMPATARRFGLAVNARQDERLDPRKSTEAATRYLRWLHEYFQDWPLALAAYNCGEGAMKSFLRKCGATSLAELSVVSRNTVPQETLRFVPQFVAAAAVMTAGGLLTPPDEKTQPQQSSSLSPLTVPKERTSVRQPSFPHKEAKTVPGMRRIGP